MTPSRMQERFQDGQRLHEQGRLAEAARVYEEILAADAGHAGALHWLGVIAYQTGDLPKALDLISRSLAADPQSALAHANLGNVFSVLGRFEEGLACYDRAIALRPDLAVSHVHRGNVLGNLGRYDEALDSFDRAISLRPGHAETHCHRGIVLAGLKRLPEAVVSYDRAIALNPDHVDSHFNRGAALYDLGRFEQALASYDRAIALKPDLAEAHGHRGLVLEKLGRLDEALAGHDRAIALNPGHADNHFNRGAVLCDMRRFAEALASCDQAILLRPDLAEAHGNRALALHELGRFAEALASCGQAIALKPDFTEAHATRAALNLLQERYEEGWPEYEWRRMRWKEVEQKLLLELSPEVAHRPRLTSLDGIGGKTVLVHSEQGLGDTIQFCRYIELLERAGATVLFAPQRSLRALLSSRKGGARLVAAGEQIPPFDAYVSLLSLPLLFSTARETIPAGTPYLSADSGRAETWRQRIGGQGFRIGVCWQGSGANKRDPDRSFSAARFEGLAAIAGVRLISLQKGSGAEQLGALPEGMAVESLGDDFDAGPDAFLDTAAVMTGLDLVVTSDTSVAHLAGALGVPVWVALPLVPDWRWQLERSDSPWYPTMRLFRQSAARDWQEVFDRMKSALVAKLASDSRLP